eukprot:g14743.t1
MVGAAEWESFPAHLLEAPAEDWGRLSEGGENGVDTAGEGQEEEGQEALLAQLEEAFSSDKGGHEDRTKVLETIQLFLWTRQVRLLEDLLLLTSSLGNYDNGEDCRGDTAASAPGPREPGAGALSSVASYKRELALALQHTTATTAATSKSSLPSAGVLFSGEGCDAAKALRDAAGVSTEFFFREWAERFGTLLVPLGGDAEGEADGRGGGGGGRKDDREIQAARDVERDMLSVNGVLVKGSEGYPVVVGKVKRELARLVEPVAGSDPVGGGSTAPTDGFLPGGVKPQPSPSLKQRAREDLGLPLRPPRQLQAFSKLVLKAANRTESGGLSFDAIHRIMGLCPAACDGSVLVVPDSSKAEPLGINITAESFTEKGDTAFGPLERNGVPELLDGLHTFGICARVEAVTVYSLYNSDMERVYLRLRATFRNSLRLPVSPFSSATCQTFWDVGYRGENGEVQIEVVEGDHRSWH